MYLTVDKEYCYSYEVSKSKFISYLKPISTFEDGLDYLAKIQKKHNDATHNCYAIIGTPESNQFKYSDDGEPSQTAGLPIFKVLQHNELYSVALIVTRYYGGIKLGANGLVTNYTKSASEVVKCANIVKMEMSKIITFKMDYNNFSSFAYNLNKIKHTVLEKIFLNDIEMTIALPTECFLDFKKVYSSFTSGNCELQIKEEKYIQYNQ